MLNTESFRPTPYLRNGHLQTILASSSFRAWGKNPMCDAAREMIITTSEDVRLLGFYSPQKYKKSKGLVILLHGWEGSVASTYILRTGNALYGRGYDIFRLNFRDHGDSHHLNQGDFNSASEYFREYSLLQDTIKDLPVPATIITAKDDPIIPVADFYQLELNHHTHLVIHAFGGHNAFIDGFFLKSWYEQKLADMFDKIVLNNAIGKILAISL